MRYLTSALLLAALSVIPGSAASCTNGSLAAYIALGPGGCTIGTDTLSNFTVEPGLNGGTPISTSAITIKPFGGSLDPGISTMVQQSAAGNILEAIFSYRISGNLYQNETYALSGSSETGSGAVTGLQNNCSGGVFSSDGVSGCSGVSGTLLTLDGTQNQDFSTFALPAFLNITDDLTIDGTNGSASAGTLTDQFTAVPEPSSFTLTAIALFTASGLLFRRSRKPPQTNSSEEPHVSN